MMIYPRTRGIQLIPENEAEKCYLEKVAREMKDVGKSVCIARDGWELARIDIYENEETSTLT